MDKYLMRDARILMMVILGSTGCMIEGGDPEFDSASQALRSENALTINALTINALTINALTINALTINALTINALTINSLSTGELELGPHTGDLQATESGRLLLEYVIRCAYGPGDFVRVDDPVMGPARYQGNLGLAEIWKHRPIGADYQRLMSACLLAHLNRDGEPVPISVRYFGAPAVTESESHYFGDGVFYGNVFESEQKRYACTIRQREGTSPAAASPWAGKRVCDVDGNCGITHTGFCDEVCDVIVPDGDQWHFFACHDGQPRPARTVYDFTFSVWLAGSDAPQCGPGRSDRGFTCKR